MTSLDIGSVSVSKLVIHRIPKTTAADRKSGQVVLRLSEAETSLDTTKRNFFQRRLVKALEKALIVVQSTELKSPCPASIRKCLEQPEAFIEVSQDLASRLFETQDGAKSPGLLAVIDCATPAGRFVALLKLEMEAGVQVTDSKDADGKLTLEVEINDITLADSTRVYKAAIFTTGESGELVGKASDLQRDLTRPGALVAEYFLDDFLGFRLRDTADVATRQFMESAEKFINEIPDQQKKARYHHALLAELEKPSESIDPRGFATASLDKEDRDSFEANFRVDGTVPLIPKENTLIQNQLQSTIYEFENGVRLTGPPEQLQKVVTINKDGAGVVVRSKLLTVGPARKRKSRSTPKGA